MAKKLGDVVIALLILTFVIAGFSLMAIEFDNTSGVSSGIVTSSLASLEGNLSEVRSLERSFTDKLDNTSAFIPEENTDVNTLGSEGGGILNLLSKNILVRFGQQLSTDLQIHPLIIGFILSLIAVGITLLFIRMFIGEAKV